MNRSIAFFDFDGTITTKDTLLEFIKFSRGKWGFYMGFALNLPYLLAYKLKLISNQKAKERILAHFFANTTVGDFETLCNKFAQEVIPVLIRSKATATIKKLKTEGTDLVIVSASPDNWITPWAKQYGITVIATRLAIEQNKLTGKIDGKNCYGVEKVNRIQQLYNLDLYKPVYAYGDTSGDKPMLQLADFGFMKPFH